MALTQEHLRIPAANGWREISQPDSRGLYRTAGIAAFAAAVITPIIIAVFAAWPPPYEEGARKWFELLQDDPLLGLISLDLGYVVVNVLMIPVMLGLFVALRRVSPSVMTLSVVVFLVGLAAFFSTNPSIEMLTLSEHYADASSEAERIALLGAGEGLLASFEGTAFHLNYILAQLAGIAIGFVALRSGVFSRKVGGLMIAGNAIGFGLYLPVVGLALSAFAGVVLWIWLVAIGRGFFKLSHMEPLMQVTDGEGGRR